MEERSALAIISIALGLMALGIVRPSSGMRIVVLMLLLVAVAVLGMTFGLKDLASAFAGGS
jgi:uncharacterized membrane protein